MNKLSITLYRKNAPIYLKVLPTRLFVTENTKTNDNSQKLNTDATTNKQENETKDVKEQIEIDQKQSLQDAEKKDISQQAQDEGQHDNNSHKSNRGSRQYFKRSFMDRLKQPTTYVIPISVGILFTIFYTTDYAQKQREAQIKRSQASRVKTVGNPLVGGSFTLMGTDGKVVTNDMLKDRWLLIYFGFTNCPDICPEEMKKIATVMDSLDPELANKITPLFITIDPLRDTAKAVEDYVNDFHPSIVGLIGTPDQIKDITKKYRVYYSIPEDTDRADYLIDHSMYIYFMGPNNQFKDYFARAVLPREMKDRITNIMRSQR